MENLQEKIAKRAFELFQARGGQHGYNIADWLQAEKEMTSVKKPSVPAAPSKPAVVAEKATSVPVAKKKAAVKK